MGRSKRTPERSKLVRAQTPAFARRQRPGASSDKEGDDEEPGGARASTAEPTESTQTEIQPLADPSDLRTQLDVQALPEAADAETQPVTAKDLPAIQPPDPGAEPWPDATPQPMRPVDPPDPSRPRGETVAMPASAYGRPPDMPRSSAPPPLVLGDVENPAHMPGPREIPGGNPDDPAPAPGRVPPGDSRSLRRDVEFALVYRVGTCVITRTGLIGTRGQWRVVDYPTSSSAANSYAKECSRFVSDGFSDYRE